MAQTILVVDDEPEILRLVGTYLERASYRVLTGEDGREALLVPCHEKPDLSILGLDDVRNRWESYGTITASHASRRSD
jgi:DNA-binding response OmpR family regulator